jgi:hypothetical protein
MAGSCGGAVESITGSHWRGSMNQGRRVTRRRLTPRSSGRVEDKVPVTSIGSRAAQLTS